MNKELKVFKRGSGTYTIKNCNDISARHLEVQFEEDHKVEEHDLFWLIDHMNRGLTNNIMVVCGGNDNRFILKKPGDDFLTDEVKYKKGDKLTLIATYRKVEE